MKLTVKQHNWHMLFYLLHITNCRASTNQKATKLQHISSAWKSICPFIFSAFIGLTLNLVSSTRCLGTFGMIVFDLASSLDFQRPAEFLMKDLVSFVLL